MATTTRNELHEAIDRLNDEQAEQVMALVHQLLTQKPDPLWECLKTIPGLTVPDHWPPQFAEFEPLPVEGEPASEQLIRERR